MGKILRLPFSRMKGVLSREKRGLKTGGVCVIVEEQKEVRRCIFPKYRAPAVR